MHLSLPSDWQVMSNVIVHFDENLFSGNTKVYFTFQSFHLVHRTYIISILLHYHSTEGHTQIILNLYISYQ